MVLTLTLKKMKTKFKINHEILRFFFENGAIIDEKYLYFPFWLEVVDKEKGIVRFHALDNLPSEITNMIKGSRDFFHDYTGHSLLKTDDCVKPKDDEE